MKKIFFLFLVWAYPILSFSAIDECKTDVYYANGILAEEEDARKNARDILGKLIKKDIYGKNESEMKKHIGEVGYSYNQTNGFIFDGIETYAQKLIKPLTKQSNNYAKKCYNVGWKKEMQEN